MTLDSPVSAVPKIGPKFTELLKKLEIYTVKDLLFHFPFRYEDYSNIKKIKELRADEPVTIQAALTDVQNIFTKNRKKLTKATVEDETGKMEVVWFNQHFIKNSLVLGKSYWISGKPSNSYGKLSFISPVFEDVDYQNVNTGRLVPIYPETAGITSNWFRAKISFLLEKGLEFPELLPTATIEKYGLISQKDAVSWFHFPQDFDQAKQAKDKIAFEELFVEIFKAEQRKELWQRKTNGAVIKSSREHMEEFVKLLPFELSESQSKAIEEISVDMENRYPMNRLLEGDVGTGKTVVAAAASYLAYKSNFKSLYMAPTEILAKQHFKTFTEILGKCGIKVKIQTGSIKTLEEGDFDILVGTHSLLHSRDTYQNVGLLVVDEQHRFGVQQRAKIAELAQSSTAPNVLTMTATPIPRTLALAIYGDLAISQLEPIKEKERKVSTKVIPPQKREELYEWIKNQGIQTFVVCPLIQDSESESLENVRAAEVEYQALKKNLFSEKEIGLLHGKMKPQEKDEMVEQFREGKIKVLVSTPVIEVGIDIPEANIIVIESAERYGLASLHQLRGRVGRKGEKGFCFLLPSKWIPYSVERLKNLEVINKGIELAELDMKLRGEGELFGTKQHGIKKFKAATFDDINMLQTVQKEVRIVIDTSEGNRIAKTIQDTEMKKSINN